MASKPSYNDSNIVLAGVPFDQTVSYKPGTRFGPSKIREVSYVLEEFSFYSQRDLTEVSFYDFGDMELPFGNIEKALKIIENHTDKFLIDNKTPIFFGGEHLITLPIVKKYTHHYNDLSIIQLDAHADLRENYLGEKLSHACVIRNITEYIPAEKIYQLGIRSGTSDELTFAKNNTNFYPFEVVEPLEKIKHDLKDRPVYVTIDIDVVDPAFAPGTGTPEPGGITSREMIKAVKLLGQLNIVGLDIVELLPASDISERTALLAAWITREILLALKGDK